MSYNNKQQTNKQTTKNKQHLSYKDRSQAEADSILYAKDRKRRNLKGVAKQAGFGDLLYEEQTRLQLDVVQCRYKLRRTQLYT